jgi:signal transduction histidine kinase
MSIKPGNSNKNGSNLSSGEYYDKNRKLIETLAYAGISGAIIAVILLMMDQKLISGIIIIITACISLYLLKKVITILNTSRNSIVDVSSSSEKKDDVITDFSHKIREPLNNIVIITDILMESGIEKKQKELLETFVASTKNMVTIVNELTMQSAGNLSMEDRKYIRFNLLSSIQNIQRLRMFWRPYNTETDFPRYFQYH